MEYELSKNDYRILVSGHGAELISFEKSGSDYLWDKKVPYWQRQAPVLFPIVGKLKENTYVYNGVKYTLPQHGFARDSEFELKEKSERHLLFRLLNNRNPNYPFSFELYIEYSIDLDGVTTRYIVHNIGTGIMPFSIGAHPAFKCPFYPDEQLEDYFFEFEKDEKLNRNLIRNGLLTGENKVITLSHKKLFLSEALFMDDALVLSGLESTQINLRSELYFLKLTCKNYTYLGLWKQPGAPFVCIEPWWGVTDHFSHSQNFMDKRGLNFLEPGERKEFQFTISII